jgi:hypothetical protein
LSGEKCIRMSTICIPRQILICISFLGAPESKRSLGKHMHKRGDSIKMCSRECGWEDVDWIHLAQDIYK